MSPGGWGADEIQERWTYTIGDYLQPTGRSRRVFDAITAKLR